MNIIMVGGQVLIVFKGGEAFEILPLNGKEWGMSIGLGAISIPWGVVIRLTPDSWFSALVSKVKMLKPIFKLKRKSKETPKEAADAEKQAVEKTSAVASGVDDEFGPPLRTRTTLSMIRGRRSRIRSYGTRVSKAGHRAVHGTHPEGHKTK